MSISRARVSGFSPAVNGLHFDNTWPHVPDWRVSIAGGVIAIGDAANGMCGGMAYTVRDLFEAGLLPPDDRSAPRSGPLFDYVANRLLASFDLPGGPLEYIGAMSPLLPDVGRSAIIRQAWADIRPDIDAQRLSPIGVIKVRSALVTDIGRNHQCLVFGYDLDGSHLTLHTFNPNSNSVDVTLTMDLAAENITIESSDGTDVFSLFRTNYHPVFPAPLVGSLGLRHRLGIADVVFAASGGQLHDLSLLSGRGWATWQLPGPPAAGRPREYVTTSFDQASRVVYRGADEHLHELSLEATGLWTSDDLSVLTGSPEAAGDPSGYVTRTIDRAARVVYLDAAGHIGEFTLIPGAAWHYADLSQTAAPLGGLVTATGPPHGCATPISL